MRNWSFDFWPIIAQNGFFFWILFWYTFPYIAHYNFNDIMSLFSQVTEKSNVGPSMQFKRWSSHDPANFWLIIVLQSIFRPIISLEIILIVILLVRESKSQTIWLHLWSALGHFTFYWLGVVLNLLKVPARGLHINWLIGLSRNFSLIGLGLGHLILRPKYLA